MSGSYSYAHHLKASPTKSFKKLIYSLNCEQINSQVRAKMRFLFYNKSLLQFSFKENSCLIQGNENCGIF